jgi:hypothetical protein
MHGGAPGSGGPKGPRNGNYKRGLYTSDAIAARRWFRQQIRQVKALTKTLSRRIYQETGGPPQYKWFWALGLNGPIGKRSVSYSKNASYAIRP